MTSWATRLLIAAVFSLVACAGVEHMPEQMANPEINQEARTLRQLEPNMQQGEVSCLEQCGQEARATIYSDCLTAGGEQQECGSTGREWYRNCLQTRCDESALQQDDCRTECRSNAKNEFQQCRDAEEPEVCRTQLKDNKRECIAECK